MRRDGCNSNALLQAESKTTLSPETHYKRWREVDDGVLFEDDENGAPLINTAVKLGRTYNAVLARRHYLGLSRGRRF